MADNSALMPPAGTVRSCKRCHEAKRKCDRGTPSCQLCKKKNLECIYPSQKPSEFVPIQSASPAPSSLPPDFDILDFSAAHNSLAVTGTLPSLTPDAETQELAAAIGSCGSWFLAPETFLVDHTPMPLPPGFKISDLHDFVRIIENCLLTWVTTGSNLFIHAHLYERKFPSCLQIAFATYSAYLNRTPATTAMILRTVNDQATALLANWDEICTERDLLDDLAHIHALLAYQLIGLFNGDIRSRHLAEKRADHLLDVLNRALEDASASLSRTMLESELPIPFMSSRSSTELLWQSWIVSESLRRTWLVCHGICASYDGLKQEWASCHGDVMFSIREGLWSADSALLWATMCAGPDVRLVGRCRAEYMFGVAPDGVDDFAKIMLELIFGKDRCMRWLCSLQC